ncbi:MAG: hypothetical protein IJ740_00980 [Ruminococcus sp.]|nr:hypothetical protein [Ruminococcus sp.]
MKRLNVILLLALFALLFLTRLQTQSITDKSIVHAAGIDKSGSELSVTLQVFKPEAAGADTPIDISKANFKTIKASGSTTRECLSKLSAQAGSELFFGHLQLIVIGRDVMYSSPDDIFSPFLTDLSIYPGTYLACADSAEKTVSLPIKENAVTAENYKKIIEVSSSKGICIKASLDDIPTTFEETGTLAMPYITIKGENEDKHLDISGSGVMNAHSFDKSLIPKDECKYLSLVTCGSDSDGSPLELDVNGNFFGLKNISRSYSADHRQDGFHISIKISADTDLPKDKVKETESALSEKLESAISSTLSDGIDAAALYKQLRLQCPWAYAESESTMMTVSADITLYSKGKI